MGGIRSDFVSYQIKKKRKSFSINSPSPWKREGKERNKGTVPSSLENTAAKRKKGKRGEKGKKEKGKDPNPSSFSQKHIGNLGGRKIN